jgi:endonuclease/exonuclease/phosphatase family metal-dependent hydrolase
MSRPHTIRGLVLHLARAKPCSLGCALVVLAFLAFVCVLSRCGRSELRAATFNIENYPRDERQVRGAFEAISALDAPIVAVQEITDPAAFERAARERLGDDWRFVHNEGGPLQRVGVLYDSEQLVLAYARTHDETRLSGVGKPALEVRLRRIEGRAIRVFVVHLKAGGRDAGVRREQLRRLAPIVRAAADSWDDVLVLGDFNATGEDDRATLGDFARQTRLVWASEDLECTSYWDRNDGCRGAALDHVFTRAPTSRVGARGPCEDIGCSPGDRCPMFHREVSDHCPVTVDL